MREFELDLFILREGCLMELELVGVELATTHFRRRSSGLFRRRRRQIRARDRVIDPYFGIDHHQH